MGVDTRSELGSDNSAKRDRTEETKRTAKRTNLTKIKSILEL